jgi:hypothetical protein
MEKKYFSDCDSIIANRAKSLALQHWKPEKVKTSASQLRWKGVERALTAPRVAIETPSTPPPLGSMQPSPTESSPDETADRLLRAVATDFVVSGNSLSIDKEMALYAERVDYYGKGVKRCPFK